MLIRGHTYLKYLIRSNIFSRNTLICFNLLVSDDNSDFVRIRILDRYNVDTYTIEKGSHITIVCESYHGQGKLHVIDIHGKTTNNLPTTPDVLELPTYQVNETNFIYGTYYCTEVGTQFQNATLTFRTSEVPNLFFYLRSLIDFKNRFFN